MELYAYMRIRGWLGPPRWDAEVAQLSLYAGSPYKEGEVPELTDLRPKWPRGLPIPESDEQEG